jgi:lysophospholipase L1-like esterase
MNPRRRKSILATWVVVVVVVVALCLLGTVGVTVLAAGRAGAGTLTDPVTAAAAAPAPAYLALGASASVGVQPSSTAPGGQPTDDGYADKLVASARSRWPGLELTKLGCPGETTATMITGVDRCRYPQGSQLSAAAAFLRAHPSTRLITVDLGFNGIRGCMTRGSVAWSCVATGIAQVRQQLPTVLSALRAAAGPETAIVGVGHYDPFLAAALRGPAGQQFADASLRAIGQLDQTLRSIYAQFGMPMADVLGAFHSTDTAAATVAGQSTSVGVQQVCQLTWMCARHPLGPNIHPTDRGYQVIADAINGTLGTVG